MNLLLRFIQFLEIGVSCNSNVLIAYLVLIFHHVITKILLGIIFNNRKFVNIDFFVFDIRKYYLIDCIVLFVVLNHILLYHAGLAVSFRSFNFPNRHIFELTQL